MKCNNNNPEPNTLSEVSWPDNVLIFQPPDPTADPDTISAEILKIKERIKPTQDPSKVLENGTLDYNSENHFSTKHYALLFAPGTYPDCDFQVGYYVQAAGLGAAATDVSFTGKTSGPSVPALNKYLESSEYSTVPYDGAGICLDTFWRAAENFSVAAEAPLRWAVSQAAPLRRVHVKNDVEFGDGGAYASGGVFANGYVGGHVNYIAQQQWFTRNVEFGGKASGGSWNLTFSGCTGGVPQAGKMEGNPNIRITVENQPVVRVEKPFVVLTEDKKWELHVPQATRDFTSGPALDGSTGDRRDFSRVKVCKMRPDDKDAMDIEAYNVLDKVDETITAELQAALDEGKDLVMCPGTFYLTRALEIKFPNQVILGLGLATLIAPQDGSPCVRVRANVPGVRIAGITVEGSMQKKSPSMISNAFGSTNSDGVRSLIDFGEPGKADPGDSKNPGALVDIFARVGGINLEREKVMTDTLIRVHSGNVVGDNLWLWRADHVQLREGEEPNDPSLALYHQVRSGECGVKNALEVKGNDVHMYGLFCEHTTEHQLVWSGSRGGVLFFQCEKRRVIAKKLRVITTSAPWIDLVPLSRRIHVVGKIQFLGGSTYSNLPIKQMLGYVGILWF
mmetsp:Transcript_22725/g.40496  ORF Transcript_22725/g.40496 Transcript_22725/m.40496 type:complete len:620 (+) Transcript_22725:414-2273(+)